MIYFRFFIQLLFYLSLFYNLIFILGQVVYGESSWAIFMLLVLSLLLYLLLRYLRNKTVRVYVVERSTKFNILLLLKILIPVVLVISFLELLYTMTEGNQILAGVFAFICSLLVIVFIFLLKKWK